jgi:dihydroorotase
LTEGGISVDNGTIVSVAKEPNLPSADVEYDAEKNIVLPGLIDLHVHFRDPGYPEREDFFTGTSAAAVGGFTCIGDMPNPNPPTVTTKALEEKMKIGESKALVDFALYGGTGERSLNNIESLSKKGVKAFKTYMTKSYEDLSTVSLSALKTIMDRIAHENLPLMVHAEDSSIIELEKKRIINTDLKGFEAHSASRPRIAEETAVNSALTLAGNTGARVYICHLSCSEAVDLVRQAKAKGIKVTAETCPHYLLLTRKEGGILGPYAKTNPPLRSPKDVESLWAGIKDGTIDVVSSDHCPYTRAEKDEGALDIFKAPPGMPGLDTSIRLMLTQVNSGRLSLEKLVNLYSENPAKILGAYPKKGALLPGSDADITIIDLKKEELLESDNLYTKPKISMFEGYKIKGVPIATFVRGNQIMENHEIVGAPGHGRFI